MARPRKDVFVKVARTGSRAVDVCLNEDKTVEAALEIAGITAKASEDIRVNGKAADLDQVLKDGDRVTLIKDIEGAH